MNECHLVHVVMLAASDTRSDYISSQRNAVVAL